MSTSTSPRWSRMGMWAVPELCVFDLDACLWDKEQTGVAHDRGSLPRKTESENLVRLVSFERLCCCGVGMDFFLMEV